MTSRDKSLKMAIIAGASFAIAYKEKNSRATESEILKYVTSKIQEILNNLSEED